MIKQVLYAQGMNIGGRIDQQLRKLKWERKDLLERVPDLTAQALSNLIRRDSKRSEWDEIIAEALGVSVLWLVYGKEEAKLQANERLPAAYLAPLSSEESFLVQAYRSAGQEAKTALMSMAKVILPNEQGLNERTGTK